MLQPLQQPSGDDDPRESPNSTKSISVLQRTEPGGHFPPDTVADRLHAQALFGQELFTLTVRLGQPGDGSLTSL